MKQHFQTIARVEGRNATVRADLVLREQIIGYDFSITGGVWFNHRVDLSPSICGCIHDILSKAFPRGVKPYVKWHLFNSEDGPTHYVENALYWLGLRGWCNGGKNDPPNFEIFKSHCVWPELSEDGFRQLRGLSVKHVKLILEDRLPALIEAFKADMEKIGLPIPAK